MDESRLDSLLTRSAPEGAPAHPLTEARISALVADAREKAQPIRRRRRLLWLAAVPIVPALGFALTAGIEARLAPDLTIPVSYTTDTGVAVSCSIFEFNGEINYVETSFAGVDYLRTQDWTDIGSRIYAAALVQEAALTAQGDVDPATLQESAWSLAASDLVDGSVPDAILHDGDHWGTDSDCSGQLH